MGWAERIAKAAVVVRLVVVVLVLVRGGRVADGLTGGRPALIIAITVILQVVSGAPPRLSDRSQCSKDGRPFDVRCKTFEQRSCLQSKHAS